MSNDKMTTPVGVAVYPALTRPDTKFDELGQYKGDVRIPVEEAKSMMAKLADIFKNHTGKAPSKSGNTMWDVEEDDDGNPTGNVIFKIRVKNKINRRGDLWDRKPALFDAKLKPLSGVNPWGGTEMRVNFDVYPWDAGGKKGVSLQLIAVQVINLVEGGSSADATAYGFGEEEGFTADTTVEDQFSEETTGDDEDF